MKYVFIGGGVANIYTICYGIMNNIINMKHDEVIVIEKGKHINDRIPTIDIVNGLLGGGAFSDNKNVFSLHDDQPIFEYINKQQVLEYYDFFKNKLFKMFLPENASIHITQPVETGSKFVSGYGDIALKQSECYHVGSTLGLEMCKNMIKWLEDKGVTIYCNSTYIPSKLDKCITVRDTNGVESYITYDKLFIGLGRSGMKDIKETFELNNIKSVADQIHIGFRFECEYNNTIQELANNIQYDFKFSKNINKNHLKELRTFCVNHGTAEVVTEKVKGYSIPIREQANGHAYGLHVKNKWTGKSNWAILGSFKNVNVEDYLSQIETITNGKIYELNQKSSLEFLNCFDNLGDSLSEFVKELCDILDIKEWKGYFPEIKIIGPRVNYNDNFTVQGFSKNIFFVGDSAITRGIIPAAVTGIHALLN
ncbi:putative NAD(FAD)-utilizing dehydrogenase [Campylobacter phage CP39]|nr:putative NAD(FAD)-utilizing dehydrogenase [Campylobacter phage CP39]